jgi:predicted RNase H-like HicB family nuclease
MTVKPAEYLKRPYGRVVVPEEDGTFRAEIIEFPGCIAVGDTAAEALANLESVAESWLQATIAKGLRVPEPIENTEFSGKLVVRLPKTLHKKAAHAAAREGVSLNQFIVSCIAEQVGARSAEAPGPIQLTQAAQPTSLTGARSRSGR